MLYSYSPFIGGKSLANGSTRPYPNIPWFCRWQVAWLSRTVPCPDCKLSEERFDPLFHFGHGRHSGHTYSLIRMEYSMSASLTSQNKPSGGILYAWVTVFHLLFSRLNFIQIQRMSLLRGRLNNSQVCSLGTDEIKFIFFGE